MGIGVLARNSSLITSQINVLFVVHLLWIVDFTTYLIKGYSIFGIADYFFVGDFSFPKIISLQHIFVMPFAFYCLSVLKIKRKDVWIISFLQIFLLAALVRILTPVEENINCFYKSCVNLGNIFPYYLMLTIGSFFVILLTNSLLVKLFYRK